ncbi:MAG: sarcosine oxidase subunit delta [Gammaproteobacteria bacterium]|nr:sarcosine oxidase subunit delta [Gammaproteobacteria bacterium]MCP4875541.1 sarcosine oxidase subunit delta [Gammaproteobacteria bacterium]MCP4983412.1 sarcosine oxidase subunit delta [Gammaproteobacteria bacterium]
MFLIECPWCGERDETEFSCVGEAHIVRPLEPGKLSDDAWADYLFMRKNPKGAHREQWLHAAGCRRYFNAERDTVTYKIGSTYKIGEAPPSEGKQ